MRGLGTVALVALAMLLLCAGPAGAQASLAGSIYAGYARSVDSDAPNGSVGFRGNVFVMPDPVLGLGAEVGYHMLGEKDNVSEKAWQVTGQLIARGVVGSVRPYATAGLGVYDISQSLEHSDLTVSESKFGFNLGGGVQFKPSPGPIGFGVEARWHDVLTEGTSTNLLTVMAGITFR